MTGGEDAFRTLYRAHTPALYAPALRLTGSDQNEAEDLVQETWVRATRKMSTFPRRVGVADVALRRVGQRPARAVALGVADGRRAGHRAREQMRVDLAFDSPANTVDDS